MPLGVHKIPLSHHQARVQEITHLYAKLEVRGVSRQITRDPLDAFFHSNSFRVHSILFNMRYVVYANAT
jgi:hypothetical protein